MEDTIDVSTEDTIEDTDVNDSKYDYTEDTATDYMLIIKTFNWVFY